MKWTMVLLACVALPIAAQQPPHEPRHDHHMMPPAHEMPMMAPMMRAMAFTPQHLLNRKDSLNLTPQQVTRLTTLRDAVKQVHDGAAADAQSHLDAMAQAFNAATPDTVAVRLHFQAAHEGMGKAHAVMLTTAARARAVLTDEQRSRVQRWARAMPMMCDGEHSSH